MRRLTLAIFSVEFSSVLSFELKELASALSLYLSKDCPMILSHFWVICMHELKTRNKSFWRVFFFLIFGLERAYTFFILYSFADVLIFSLSHMHWIFEYSFMMALGEFIVDSLSVEKMEKSVNTKCNGKKMK